MLRSENFVLGSSFGAPTMRSIRRRRAAGAIALLQTLRIAVDSPSPSRGGSTSSRRHRRPREPLRKAAADPVQRSATPAASSVRACVGDHMGLIEDDCPHCGVGDEKRREQRAVPAADVDDSGEASEVERARSALFPEPVRLHRAIEDLALIRVLGPVAPDVRPVSVPEGGFPGSDRVLELAPCRADVRASDERRPAMERAGAPVVAAPRPA